MITRYRILVVVFVAVLTATVACVPTYQPPKANEPHAILKLRRTYEKAPGVWLTETLMLGEFMAFHNAIGSSLSSTTQTDAILIHPVPAVLTFRNNFTHQVTRLVMEHYTEQVPYQTTESYNCGTGTSYRTCSRSATHYRSESKTRWVNKTETVNDGSCERVLSLNPTQGSSYLLQYTYQDHSICALSCFEQAKTSDGTFSQVACNP